jgi:hypothetical protein
MLRGCQLELQRLHGNSLVYLWVRVIEIEIDVDHTLQPKKPVSVNQETPAYGHTTSLPSSELPSSSSLCFLLTLVAGTAASFVLAGMSMGTRVCREGAHR